MARAATQTKVQPKLHRRPQPRRFRGHARSRASRPSRPQEGAVIKGKIVAIENDFAVVDVGLKTEGRVPLKEFAMPGMPANVKVGDEVEVYLERVENALGEAVLSRDKARREESWIKLEKAFNDQTRVTGVIFGRVKGGFTVDLDGAVAFLPGSQVDVRPMRDVGPLMNQPQLFQILKMDRRRGNIVVSRRAVLEERRAEERTSLVASPAGKAGGRRRGQEHHRLRRLRGSGRRRRPAACHRHRLAPRSAIRPKFSRSARPSPCRSSRSTTTPSASRWA